MVSEKHKKSLRKLKFYDTNFKVFGISLLVAIVATFLFDSLTEGIGIVFAIVAIFPIIAINWGMLYHQVKSESYEWLAPISLMTFYFIKMRKEFKKGKGVYN